MVYIFIWLVLWNHGILWLSHHIGNVIIPTDFRSIIFQDGVAQPPGTILLYHYSIPELVGCWSDVYWVMPWIFLLVYHQPVKQFISLWVPSRELQGSWSKELSRSGCRLITPKCHGINGHDSGSDSLEVPSIFLRPIFQGYVRRYTLKIWPEIWYSTSNLGSWNSHWWFQKMDTPPK